MPILPNASCTAYNTNAVWNLRVENLRLLRTPNRSLGTKYLQPAIKCSYLLLYWKVKQMLKYELTCPRLTCNSSSTQGVKSCNTTILLSGDKPFSFSMPTRTKVSMEALPVIRPIPVNALLRNSFASTSPGRPTRMIIRQLLAAFRFHQSSRTKSNLLFFFFPRRIRTGHRNAIVRFQMIQNYWHQ